MLLGETTSMASFYRFSCVLIKSFSYRTLLLLSGWFYYFSSVDLITSDLNISLLIPLVEPASRDPDYGNGPTYKSEPTPSSFLTYFLTSSISITHANDEDYVFFKSVVANLTSAVSNFY